MSQSPLKQTSSRTQPLILPAEHPIKAAQTILDQIPQSWESVSQLDSVKQVIKGALPPPRPDDLVRAATLLYVAHVIDRNCYRLVWRYVAVNRPRFAAIERPKETQYPVFFAILRLYREGRNNDGQGTQAIRLLVKFSRRLAPRKQFSGGVYYRHILAFRDSTLWYWKYSDGETNEKP